jgi:ferric-dicitrate binding protein FerR (iron transport regulator)
VTPGHEIDLDRVHALMMAVLDDECSDADRRELDAMMAGHPDIRLEWDRLRRLKAVTTTLRIAQPPEELWDRYQRGVLHRTERGIAWTLVVTGIAILGTFALWQWLNSWLAAEVPLVVRVGGTALIGGGALLVASVLRERWFLSRRDPYSKEILR